jgi:hypothetical protein
MRTPIIVAVVVAGLVVPAAAAERSPVHGLIVKMPPFAARTAWALAVCLHAEAKALGSRPEPSLYDPDWVPHGYKPTVTQEIAQLFARCEPEASALAASVNAKTLARFKAAASRDARGALEFARRYANEPIKIAPQPSRR